jgi:hypothetical protein
VALKNKKSPQVFRKKPRPYIQGWAGVPGKGPPRMNVRSNIGTKNPEPHGSGQRNKHQFWEYLSWY